MIRRRQITLALRREQRLLEQADLLASGLQRLVLRGDRRTLLGHDSPLLHEHRLLLRHQRFQAIHALAELLDVIGS